MSKDGAELMQDAATKAVALAKDLLISTIEQELPIGTDPKNAIRHIGAIVAAISTLYADMLHTCHETRDNDPNSQGIINLAAGMFKTLVAEHLAIICNLSTDKDLKVTVISVTEDGHGDC